MSKANDPPRVLLMRGADDGSFTEVAIPTRVQLEAQVRSICPVCTDNAETARSMMRQYLSKAHAQAAHQRVPGRIAAAKDRVVRAGARVWSYTKAKLGGPTTEAVADQRIEMCRHGDVWCPSCLVPAVFDLEKDRWRCNAKACEWSATRADTSPTANACKHYIRRPDGEYCSSCGCGFRKDAELGVKSKMAYATCPRRIWALHPKTEGAEREAGRADAA